MEILTGEQMRRVDRRAIETLGIASLSLMEAAGRGVAEALVRDYPDAAERWVVVLCGKGNNGGDGLVAARHLAMRSVPARVLLVARAADLSGDAAVNWRAAVESGLRPEEVPDEGAWSRVSSVLAPRGVVVDALLGTGAKGGARGLFARVIEDLDASECEVVSVDLPSGLDADSTRVEGPAVRARRTYTLCRPKLALVSGPASERAGRWTVIPIGIPDEAVREEGADLEWLDADALRGRAGARRADSHKGTYGHLLAVAGSRGKSGAAVLLARGALRSGVGLVTVATPASALSSVAVQQAEMMTEPLPDTADGALARGSAGAVLGLLEGKSALAIGPGLGAGPETRSSVVEILAKRKVPTVADADALNALAAGADAALSRLAEDAEPLVLTPHPGEAARLLGASTESVQADRLEAARRLAERTGAVVVLKGHRTVIASPDRSAAINASGNPGMATGGTGDVLTGVIGALLARGVAPREAARLGAFVHGDAGDRAAAALGETGMIAGDLAGRLPEAFAALAGASAW